MAKKEYDWEEGVALAGHTKKKHAILREYFRQYLITRCQLPQQEKFRLVIVDGFSGAGRYKCGSPGSPLIFVEVLRQALNEINIGRVDQKSKPVQIECLLVLNDSDRPAIKLLKQNIAPLLAEIKDDFPKLVLKAEYLNQSFEQACPTIKQKLKAARCGNVLFNLDQYGHSTVSTNTIKDIMQSWNSAEAFLTFSVASLLAHISPNQNKNHVRLRPEIHKEIYDLLKSGKTISKKEWLGEIERILFENLKGSAPYVSPFAINNPGGWGYWLMHFANSYRARQVYNNVLHTNSMEQAHFGRSGLKMLSYNPRHEGQLYLFDENARESAKKELYDDIPKLVAESGDAMAMEDFYRAAYSETPAHSNDIHEMIMENPDVEVITESSGERRKANTIKAADTLKLKSQKSMFSMFSEHI